MVAIINSPKNFSRLTTVPILLAGKASDDVGLDRVEFRINNEAFQPALGTTSWQARVNLQPGQNVIRVRSVDLADNTSFEATRFFTYVVKRTLTVNIVGHSTVSPNLNGRQLEVGQTYSMTAHPVSDEVFAGWNAMSNPPNTVLNFIMQSNLVLTANFVPNPFLPVKGTYTGLFADTNNVAPESSGLFTLRVTSRGAFSGKLTLDGKHYRLHGRFDYLGRAKLAVLRRSLSPLAVTLNLDLINGTTEVTGAVTSGEWTSTLLGNRIPADTN